MLMFQLRYHGYSYNNCLDKLNSLIHLMINIHMQHKQFYRIYQILVIFQQGKLNNHYQNHHYKLSMKLNNTYRQNLQHYINIPRLSMHLYYMFHLRVYIIQQLHNYMKLNLLYNHQYKWHYKQNMYKRLSNNNIMHNQHKLFLNKFNSYLLYMLLRLFH